MAFPQDRLPLRVELAFGADPAGDPGAWTWTDASGDLLDQSVSIRRGRSDEASQVSAASASVQLDNRSGDYTPDHPASPHYPHVQQGVPARLSVQAGGPYMLLPDVAGAQASVASTSAMDVTGDLDVRVDVALDQLPAQGGPDTVGAEPYQPVETNLIGRYDRPNNQRAFRLILLDNGGLELTWSTDGTAAVQATCTEALPVVSGQRVAIRATLDVDNGAGGWTVTFYTAPNMAGPWARLGQPVTGAGTTSIHAPTAVPLNIGAMQPELARGAGRWYAAEVRSGIDGTAVANPDFTAQDPGTTSFSDSAGRSWLIEGGAEVTDWRVRLVGRVDEWLPTWPHGDLSDPDDPDARPGEARCDITISGILRRLGQGEKPLESTLRRRIGSYADDGSSGLLAYWPMELPSGTRRNRRAGTPVPGATFMATSGMDWGADDSLPGSSPLPKVTEGAYLNGRIPAPDIKIAPTSWAVEFVYFMPEAPASTRSLFWVTSTGTVRQWQVLYGPPGGNDLTCRIIGTDADGAEVLNVLVGLGSDVLETWVRQRLTLTQSGSSVDWELRWLKIGSTAGIIDDTYSGTIGRPKAFTSPDSYHADIAGVSLGHVSAWAPSTNAADAYNFADHGFDGESASDRLRRLAQEEGLPLSVVGSSSDTTSMGPQRPAKLLDLLQACVDADGGILSERRERLGLQYRPRTALYNQAPAIVLDASGSEIDHPFTPVLDDQRIRNDVTVSSDDGSSARVTDEQSIAEHGRYDDAVTVNVESDGQLEPIAAWRLHRGTWPGMRYPAVTSELDVAPQTITAWLDRLEGDRIQAIGLPPQHPPGTVDLLQEGSTETLTPTRWTMEANTSPAGPWTVGEIAEDDPDDDDAPTHFDTDGSELVAAVDADDTELLVLATDGPAWATTAGPSPTAAADDLPFDITVGGEVMTVASVQPLVWDTFTRSVTDGWGSTPSTISLSWLLSGGTAADRDVTGTQGTVTLPDTSAIRFQYLNAGLVDSEILTAVTVPALATGGSLRAGIVMRISGASYYQLRVNFTTSGAVGLDVVNSGSVIEAVSSIGQAYTAGSKWWIRARITGQAITGKAWLDGTAERGWQITETVTSSTIASGLPGLSAARASGNTNASPVMAFDDFRIVTPQRFGVTRSVNGIQKAHSAGADVRLANPMIFAL